MWKDGARINRLSEGTAQEVGIITRETGARRRFASQKRSSKPLPKSFMPEIFPPESVPSKNFPHNFASRKSEATNILKKMWLCTFLRAERRKSGLKHRGFRWIHAHTHTQAVTPSPDAWEVSPRTEDQVILTRCVFNATIVLHVGSTRVKLTYCMCPSSYRHFM